MKIGIIGPTKINEKEKEIIKQIAKASKNYKIILTPDKGVAEFFSQEYKKNNGEEIIGIIPKEDKEFGYNWLNLDIIDKEINCKTWRNQPETLDENSDILICFGLSPGSMIEICYTKWFKAKIYLIKELCENLPKKTREKLDIEYISYKELIKKLENGI